LIGGEIGEQEEELTLRAIEIICKIAEDDKALVICGGTDMGVMAEVGQLRWRNSYNFPLIGITTEDMVTWPGGHRSSKFLWWGKLRYPLEPHYSHFVLVPGTEFGDESPWIFEAAALLSKGNRTVTILINGGDFSRKDIELSLNAGFQVIVLNHTGRLADDLAKEPNPDKSIIFVSAVVGQQIEDVIQTALSFDVAGHPNPRP
jgi:hypothetical protein